MCGFREKSLFDEIPEQGINGRHIKYSWCHEGYPVISKHSFASLELNANGKTFV